MSVSAQTLLADLSGMTVDRLKLTIRRMNETAGTHLKLSGLKQELVRLPSLFFVHAMLILAPRSTSESATSSRFRRVRTTSPSTSGSRLSSTSARTGESSHRLFIQKRANVL